MIYIHLHDILLVVYHVKYPITVTAKKSQTLVSPGLRGLRGLRDKALATGDQQRLLPRLFDLDLQFLQDLCVVNGGKMSIKCPWFPVGFFSKKNDSLNCGLVIS